MSLDSTSGDAIDASKGNDRDGRMDSQSEQFLLLGLQIQIGATCVWLVRKQFE